MISSISFILYITASSIEYNEINLLEIDYQPNPEKEIEYKEIEYQKNDFAEISFKKNEYNFEIENEDDNKKEEKKKIEKEEDDSLFNLSGLFLNILIGSSVGLEKKTEDKKNEKKIEERKEKLILFDEHFTSANPFKYIEIFKDTPFFDILLQQESESKNN